MGSRAEPPKPVVLVVEDEPLLRMMATDMIEGAGFDVVEAAGIADAIQILESRPDIRVVFTDLDMPKGVDGMKFAAAIRDRWPPIEIILTSGRYDVNDVVLPARGTFFPKPYKRDQVIAEIRRMTH